MNGSLDLEKHPSETSLGACIHKARDFFVCIIKVSFILYHLPMFTEIILYALTS